MRVAPCPAAIPRVSGGGAGGLGRSRSTGPSTIATSACWTPATANHRAIPRPRSAQAPNCRGYVWLRAGRRPGYVTVCLLKSCLAVATRAATWLSSKLCRAAAVAPDRCGPLRPFTPPRRHSLPVRTCPSAGFTRSTQTVGWPPPIRRGQWAHPMTRREEAAVVRGDAQGAQVSRSPGRSCPGVAS